MIELSLSSWWVRRFVPDEAGARPRPSNDIPTLAAADPPHHVGLWLDRGLPWPPTGGEDKEKLRRHALLDAAVAALAPDRPARRTYAHCIARHITCPPANDHRRVVALTTASRLLLHTASNASVTEGSVLLHHTYGVPYLPGSALKGLLRRSLRHASEDLRSFWLGQGGATDREDDQAALVDIHDALWWPEAGHPSPLAVDIVNPHHSQYYTKGDSPPRESDDPVPTHRLSLAPGVRFRAVLEFAPGLAPEHIDSFSRYFCDATNTTPIGAWSTSGYGRLKAAPA